MSAPSPKSGFTEVNGLRLHHLDWGGAGAPLVCLHGLTRNAHDFDPLARSLTPAYRVLALDARGRGQSDWAPVESYQVPQYVSDLAAWLDSCGLERVSLVGTSMGGLISMFFGATYPQRVAAIALNDVGPVVERAGLQRIQKYVSGAPEQFPDLESVAAFFREITPNPALDDAALLEQARHAAKPLPDGGFGWRYDRALRDQMRGADLAAVAPPDIWPIAEALPGPTLVIRGAESDILSAETVEAMTRRMKGCTSAEVPRVGHAPALIEPEALAALERLLGA